jgi:hypothetical protein
MKSTCFELLRMDENEHEHVPMELVEELVKCDCCEVGKIYFFMFSIALRV